jgi:hypothetical protein
VVPPAALVAGGDHRALSAEGGALRRLARHRAPAVEGLLDRQHPDGHWDAENVDSTCDALRALLLSAQAAHSRPLTARVLGSGERAVRWLIGVVTEGGLGPRPGRKPRVLFTCDGIDALFKFGRFRDEADSLRALYH